MKVRDRIDTIARLFLGALFADDRYVESERRAVRRLLCELMLADELPESVERLVEDFDPSAFDLAAAARDFLEDPPMQKRRLMELVAQLCYADGELDLDEDDYMRRLAQALDMKPGEYEDLVLDYEIQELRESFHQLRRSVLDLRVEP